MTKVSSNVSLFGKKLSNSNQFQIYTHRVSMISWIKAESVTGVAKIGTIGGKRDCVRSERRKRRTSYCLNFEKVVTSSFAAYSKG